MICPFCKYPLPAAELLSLLVRAASARPLKVAAVTVRCWHCGAEVAVAGAVVKPSPLSPDQLEQIQNRNV